MHGNLISTQLQFPVDLSFSLCIGLNIDSQLLLLLLLLMMMMMMMMMSLIMVVYV